MPHTILLYYKYVAIENPKVFAKAQRKLCEELGLTGRIIIAREGINGTVEGLPDAAATYMHTMHADARFADVVFKESAGTGEAFPKLSIKVRDEIVTANGFAHIDPNVCTGKRLSADELDQWYDDGQDFVVVDMRNDYEFAVGKFKHSIMPGMRSFKDLPDKLAEIVDLKNKKVVTVCTGGVRCEKASGYLVEQGFSDVYQLDGGMATYLAQHPGKHFQGKLYVFDQRVTIDDGTANAATSCHACGATAEQFTNCANEDCHVHMIACDACTDVSGRAFCSMVCKETGRILEKTEVY